MTDHETGQANETGQATGDRYRPGVGIVLLNDRGEVFVGRRANLKNEAWQMPQGGIEPGETAGQAAFRELKEEIGTDQADVIAESRGWFQYEVPAEFAPKRWQGRWKGQRQKWFVMRLRGAESDIELSGSPEFDAWRWVPVKDLAGLAVTFKRQLYVDVIEEFTSVFRGEQP